MQWTVVCGGSVRAKWWSLEEQRRVLAVHASGRRVVAGRPKGGTVERCVEDHHHHQLVDASGETPDSGAGGEQGLEGGVGAGGGGGVGGAAALGEGGGPSGWSREGELDVVTAHFRGMLSLTDEVNDDWAFLKDFLGYKSHVRDSETGELTAPRPDADPQAVAAPRAPHLGLHAPSQLTPPSPSHAVSPPQGPLSSPLAALSPASHVGTPLPSISTLVRYPPVSSPCVSGAPECLTPGHQVPPLTPEDGCRSLEAPPTPLGSIHDSQQFSDSDASCLVPSEGSAFRSVTPSSGEILESKPSPSLLRDLLVLGKPPRSQHDQVNKHSYHCIVLQHSLRLVTLHRPSNLSHRGLGSLAILSLPLSHSHVPHTLQWYSDTFSHYFHTT